MNYEIECSTQFTGPTLQLLKVIDLRDCIKFCDYENRLRPATPQCVGVTFLGDDIIDVGDNNCVRYSSLNCATRGNVSVQSARWLFAGYPAIADYDPGFLC